MAFEVDNLKEDVMSEINMTPLVDVMLVLLIIFMITVPLMKNAVPIDLPKASAEKYRSNSKIIQIGINSNGQYSWNDAYMDDDSLRIKLEEQSKKGLLTQVHIMADKDVRYERVAQLMSSVQRVGVRQVTLVTQPKAH